MPYQFSSFAELKDICIKNNFQIKDVVLANEHALYSENDTRKYIRKIVEIMQQNIDHGINTPGILPGSIKLQRLSLIHIYAAVNTFPGLVHTARHAMGVGSA